MGTLMTLGRTGKGWLKRVLGSMVLGLTFTHPETQVALRSRVYLLLAPNTHPQDGRENKISETMQKEGNMPSSEECKCQKMVQVPILLFVVLTRTVKLNVQDLDIFC